LTADSDPCHNFQPEIDSLGILIWDWPARGLESLTNLRYRSADRPSLPSNAGFTLTPLPGRTDAMKSEQRDELIRLLKQGEDISPEWARILFPSEKREYELVYHGKEREEDVIADTLAVPLQAVRTFGKNGEEWQNKLIFGDNLQVMKSLVEMRKLGHLGNADGTPGVRLVYIDPPFATKQDFAGNDEQKHIKTRSPERVSSSFYVSG